MRDTIFQTAVHRTAFLTLPMSYNEVQFIKPTSSFLACPWPVHVIHFQMPISISLLYSSPGSTSVRTCSALSKTLILSASCHKLRPYIFVSKCKYRGRWGGYYIEYMASILR
ncbi:hypothetical protein BDR07DRAFT_1398721, partial [Suillus spraguei]